MNVKNLILGTGIFIVYLLMLGYGIEAFYPSQHYEDFCKGGESGRYAKPLGFGNCTFSKTIQTQTDQCYAGNGFPVYQYDDAGCTTSIKECNYCNKYFNETQKNHEKIVFLIALIVGIFTLFIGYGILSIEPISSALMASGIGAIFYGSIRNWDNLSDIWRFLLLVLALILLIWITLKINEKKNK